MNTTDCSSFLLNEEIWFEIICSKETYRVRIIHSGGDWNQTSEALALHELVTKTHVKTEFSHQCKENFIKQNIILFTIILFTIIL